MDVKSDSSLASSKSSRERVSRQVAITACFKEYSV